MTDPPRHPSVRFVVVPFLPPQQPALGVSSLLSVLQEQGIDGDIRYLNLGYGERIGWDLYKYLSTQMPISFLIGEVVFAQALWGERARPFEDYEQRITRWFESRAASRGESWQGPIQLWKTFARQMRAAIEEAPQVIREWADAVLEGSPRVLGLTSSFQQSAAALALAREVRRRVPAEETAILLGGANCEDEMGRAMAEHFDFVDCVVSGEAEEVIGELVRGLLDGENEGVPRFVEGPRVHEMDALPIPDFDDYFAAAEEVAPEDVAVKLAAESSRGCWWGVKSHCTFCGLNGGGMAFRKKSPERFASELEALSERYGLQQFNLTDNILDMSYLRTLMPRLVAEGRQYKLFYETKSNLRKDQVELLAAAGVYMLQPGIESFSTPVLKRMGKGTTRLQNVQVLKWCDELGVVVLWNLLYGFPGEEPSEYEEMAEMLPSLFHLSPPMGSGGVRLDRFGPYWTAPERYGVRNVRHVWSYDFLFAGVPDEERDRLAYYFEYEHEDGRNPQDYAAPVVALSQEWRQASEAGAELTLRSSESGPLVVDRRPCRTEERYSLTPAGLALVRVLDGICNRDNVHKAIRDRGVEVAEAEVESLLDDFAARRFVLEENGCLLGLIVDPEERKRVADCKVALRCERMGFRWPDDFPDPAQQQIVRAAMLSMKAPRSGTAAVSAT